MIIIDRIEEDIAVVYFGDIRRDIPVAQLPDGVHEGSILKETASGYELDLYAEKERRKIISERTKRLFGKK